jgi:hypothetical protein
LVTETTTAWLDSTAVQPGGVLAVEKRPMLGPFDVVPGRLVAGESGVHRYGLLGSPGVILQAKVATDAFEPVVVVISPSGARWDLSDRARAADAGRGGAGGQDDLTLTEKGIFVLVVTSRENVQAGRAVTTGEYRLTLLSDAPRKAAPHVPTAPPSSRSGRFVAWESDPC